MSAQSIPQDVIDRANFDIVDVIGKRIDLKKAGKNWMACCPFHKEKSASFSVNEQKGFYYCFGCGAGGDAVKFVAEYESLNFRQAVESIVGNMAISITPEMIQKRATAAKINYPVGHCEDAAKAAEFKTKFVMRETHPYLLSRNTAPCGNVPTHKGLLMVEVMNQAGKVLNIAAISGDKVSWLAGGPTYGATARLLPMGEYDGETILCLDYAEAWRVWWARGGRSIVLAAIDPSNFTWMQYQAKSAFTMIAAHHEELDDLCERGHSVIPIPPMYRTQEKALG